MPDTARRFLYLIIKAASEAEAYKAIWEWVKPETCHSRSMPFVQSAGLFVFDIGIVGGIGPVREWANCYKHNDKPSLYAWLDAPDPATMVQR